MRTAGFGLSAETSTRGVLPIRSSTLGGRHARLDLAAATYAPPPATAGRIVTCRPSGDLGVELVQVAHVVVVEIDVDELVELAVPGERAGRPSPGYSACRASRTSPMVAPSTLTDRCPAGMLAQHGFGRFDFGHGPPSGKVDYFRSDTNGPRSAPRPTEPPSTDPVRTHRRPPRGAARRARSASRGPVPGRHRWARDRHRYGCGSGTRPITAALGLGRPVDAQVLPGSIS